ncbi:hypothetical protein J2TS4_25970 [Paenibacillus sp. J2TS4]|nr:hypothetical protein J2TS4_25970 [Paenibacillus sp. J2TS4]
MFVRLTGDCIARGQAVQAGEHPVTIVPEIVRYSSTFLFNGLLQWSHCWTKKRRKPNELAKDES